MTAAFEGFENSVCSAVPLSTMTWFRIGGPAEHLIEPRSAEEMARLVRRCLDGGIPVRVLGSGSNVLVSDGGVSGAVFRLSKMNAISRSGSRVVCEAGASLPRLVHQAEPWGLSGLEPLAGIPGTVGGAVAMNAGGRHGSVASVLDSVTTLDRLGLVHERTAEELGPDGRRSRLRGEIVLEAALQLAEKDPVEIAETRVALLEEKARTQPLTACSAGCVFKNPDGAGAGELIDLAGLKGERVGGAVVSPRHANFILNEGGATARDVRELIGLVRKRVRKMFGVTLELEIELWN